MGFTSNTLPINYTTGYYDVSKDERVGPSWGTILGTVLNPFASVADLIDDFLNDLRDDTNGRLNVVVGVHGLRYGPVVPGQLCHRHQHVGYTGHQQLGVQRRVEHRAGGGTWPCFSWRPVANEQTADIHETVSVAAATLTYEAAEWDKKRRRTATVPSSTSWERPCSTASTCCQACPRNGLVSVTSPTRRLQPMAQQGHAPSQNDCR